MLLGTALDMFELLDLQGIGLVLVSPVGLFENLVLPVCLIAKGFNTE